MVLSAMRGSVAGLSPHMKRSGMRGPDFAARHPGDLMITVTGPVPNKPARPTLACPRQPREGPHHPATARRAVLGLSGALPQSQILSGERRERLCLCIRPAAVRSQPERSARVAFEQQAERVMARLRLPGGGRLVAVQCAQVQCLLHARAVALRHVQRGL